MIDHRLVMFGRVALLGAVAAVSSCGGGDLVLPSGAPAAMAVAGGEGQQGTVGTPLPESLVVRVTDSDGGGVAGIEVTWTADGGGSVDPGTSLTDVSGHAATQRMLGEAPGDYGTTASAAVPTGSPVVFAATAMADAPTADRSAVQASPGTIQASTGSQTSTVTVTVRDRHGNPLAGVTVVLSATGSGNTLVQPSGPTNGAGRVTGRFSSTAAGQHVVSASAGGVTVAQTATVTVVPAAIDARRSEASVPNGTAGAATTVTVQLRDRFDNPVSGAGAKLDVTVEGTNPTSRRPVSDAGGGTYTATYTPTNAGIDLVHVRADNQAVAGSPFASTVSPGAASGEMSAANVPSVASSFRPVTVTIEVRDAFGNPVNRGGDNVAVTVDNDQGTFQATYVGGSLYQATFGPLATGNHSIGIAVNGAPLQGSPFPLLSWPIF